MTTVNPGPATTIASQPQASIGNIQKNAIIGATLTPAAVSAAITAVQSFTITALGVIVGDQVSAITPPSAAPAGVFPLGGIVTAADTVAITFVNVTAGSLTPPSGVYLFEVNRAQSLSSLQTEYLNSF